LHAPPYGELPGWQSASVDDRQLDGQQPSATSWHCVIGCAVHAALQLSGLPLGTSIVHVSPSEHDVGQLPSHVSPVSTTPLPHVGEQSASEFALQPGAQQPSPLAHSDIGWNVHAALQLSAAPTRTSIVHDAPSVHAVGHDAPSQISPASTTPLPQVGEQSESELALQPGAQQPSPPVHCAIGWNVHAALHVDGDPVSTSPVHALPSSHAVGHDAPSHVSPGESTPSPQNAEQSESSATVHPAGQQPSPAAHVTIGSKLHAALHDDGEPASVSVVHALPSLHDAGQFPSQTSPSSIWPLPHVAEQSSSVSALHPGAQQPSPLLQVVIGSRSHATSHVPASPTR
jgi:hypothetical protein